MKQRPSLLIVTAIIVVCLLMVLGVFVFHGQRLGFQPFSDKAQALFSGSGWLHNWGKNILQWKHLVTENNDLKIQIEQERASAAAADALEKENVQLRAALHLGSSFDRSATPAGLFSVSLGPDGYGALLNKGSNDHIAVGDTVVSPTGMLIGVVHDVFSRTARITLVIDPVFQVTARVFKGTTTGIAKGTMQKGMRLELIVQADPLEEGDTLISTGNDMMPAGLIIGTVKTIHISDTQLFKDVTVTPAADFHASDVIVLGQ